MTRSALALLALLAPATAEEQLFDLTLDRMPTTAEFLRLNALVELPEGFLDILRRDGFVQRAVTLRPGVAPDRLLSLGEVQGVALSDPALPTLPGPVGWSGGNVIFDPGTTLNSAFGNDSGRLLFDSRQTLALNGDTTYDFNRPGPTLLGPDGSVLLFPDDAAVTALLSDIQIGLDPDLNAAWTVPVTLANGGLPDLVAGSLTAIASRMAITQGLPEGQSVIQETAGACTAAAPPDWPFPVARVAEVIAFGDRVLAEAMLDPPIRARILVVDSGLPAALLADPGFRRLLEVNRREAMGAGPFARNSEESSSPKGCRDLDRDNGASLYGFIPVDENRPWPDDYCQPAQDPVAAIAPPRPDTPMQDYDPAHGALVAGLAAGGPALIDAVPGLPSHLAVAMARIARVERHETARQIASSVNDALAGIVRAARPYDDAASDQTYPQARRFDVLNLSLSLAGSAHADRITSALAAYVDDGGLIVVAAGNSPAGGAAFALDHFDQQGVPNSGGALAVVLGQPDAFDGAIVVGGTAPGPIPYDRSNWSPRIVDIAAPATGVLSFGLDGGPACAPGTSIATPQVSFVAAMLVSFGLWDSAEVKRRILATADLVPALQDRVRDGRVLNVTAALDVFADLVWMADVSSPTGMSPAPLRLRILDRSGRPGGRLVQLCAEGSDRFVDTRELVLWERIGAEGRVWRTRDGGGITAYAHACTASAGAMLPAIDLATGLTEDIPIDQVARIVPSRFRLGDAVLRAAGTP